jgi:hypothetical protein
MELGERALERVVNDEIWDNVGVKEKSESEDTDCG